MTDTLPEIEELVRQRVMARSGSDRMEMASRMFDAARTIMIASFPTGLTERERKRLLFERTYGEVPPQDFPN